MRFGVVAFAMMAAFAIGCGGDDDADPTTTVTSETGTTSTAPANETAGASTETSTADGSDGETPEPVEFEATFTCESPIGVLEARALTGEEVEFAERVYETQERGDDLVLSVGAPLSAALRVELIIKADAVEDFPGPPAQGFADRMVCARGTIEDIGGVPSISIESADQLSVVAE